MTIYTTTLTAGQSFAPTAAMNICYLSFKMSSGDTDAGSLLGSAKSPVDGSASSTITIGPDDGCVFVDSPDRPVQGMTITCTTGTISLIVGF